MRIEQRLGRLHRIGQKHPITILNLCQKDSIEEALLALLDKKLNMFELAIGEISSILGEIEDEMSFEQKLENLWMESNSIKSFDKQLQDWGTSMITSKKRLMDIKQLDKTLYSGA